MWPVQCPKVGILATEVEGAEVPSHQPEAEHSPLDMEWPELASNRMPSYIWISDKQPFCLTKKIFII